MPRSERAEGISPGLVFKAGMGKLWPGGFFAAFESGSVNYKILLIVKLYFSDFQCYKNKSIKQIRLLFICMYFQHIIMYFQWELAVKNTPPTFSDPFIKFCNPLRPTSQKVCLFCSKQSNFFEKENPAMLCAKCLKVVQPGVGRQQEEDLLFSALPPLPLG